MRPEPEFTPLCLSVLHVHGVRVRRRPAAVPPEGLFIGSSAECGLRLKASFFVAPRHLQLFARGASWFLRRLDQHFQGAVNGKKLARGETVELVEGDIIELGFVILLAHSGRDTPAEAEAETEAGTEAPEAPEPAPTVSTRPAEPGPRRGAAEELAALLAETGTGGEAWRIDDFPPAAARENAAAAGRPTAVFSPSAWPDGFIAEAEDENGDILARLARESEGASRDGEARPRAAMSTGPINPADHGDPLRRLAVPDDLSVADLLEGPLTIDAILEGLDNGRPPPLLAAAPPDPDPLVLLGGRARKNSPPSSLVVREYRQVELDAHYLNQIGLTPKTAGATPGKAGNHDDDSD